MSVSVAAPPAAAISWLPSSSGSTRSFAPSVPRQAGHGLRQPDLHAPPASERACSLPAALHREHGFIEMN